MRVTARSLVDSNGALAGRAAEPGATASTSLADGCWALLRGNRQVVITEPECVVGRGDDAHLQLNDPGVSRRHAVLRVVDDQLIVEDLGSRNGTFVQGRPIEQPVALQSGDPLRFGPCEVRVGVLPGKRRPVDCTTLSIPRELLDGPRQTGLLDSLSPRERELLPLLASGLSQRELSSRLGVTVKTIETYRTRIGHKLGVTSRAGLVRFALEHGLLSAATSLNEL